MSNKHGDFIWYELLTDDADAAQDFYGPLLGWDFSDGSAENDYREIAVNGHAIGGVMTLTPEMDANGARPCWLGYITVEDADRMVEAIRSAGGNVHLEPQDMPGVGRFALVTDPQGAMFYVIRPTPSATGSETGSLAFAATEPLAGHCAWNELATSDPEAALNFYHDLFGWEKEDEMDMGPMGKYTMLRHGFMLGGIMARPDDMPMSAWTYYFRVAEIDKAAEEIARGGGQLLAGPMEIPGGDFSLNAVDPQGAAFALVGARP